MPRAASACDSGRCACLELERSSYSLTLTGESHHQLKNNRQISSLERQKKSTEGGRIDRQLNDAMSSEDRQTGTFDDMHASPGYCEMRRIVI